MIPYFILIALPLLVCLVSKKYRLVVRGRVLYETETASVDVFMLLFFFLLAFRGIRCGSDTIQYLRIFNECNAQSILQLFSNHRTEIGYKLLNKLVGFTTGNYQVLLGITAAICVLPLWHFYKRESESPLLTIALFLTVAPYTMYFSGIRQAIAISLGIPVWYAAKKKKLGRYIVLVLVAMQFHTSAFMLFLLYPLYRARISKKWLWFVVPAMAAVFVFRASIFGVLINLLWKDYEITKATGAKNILILLVLFGVYAYVIPDEKKVDQDTAAMRNILLLSVVIQIFALLHPLSMRMNYYFLIFVPILIPKIANRSKDGYAQVAKVSAIVMTVYFVYYFVNGMITDDDPLNIFPYIPFWRNG